MSFAQALILGIIQGITEFIPISSSAHLVILPKVLGWSLQPTSFDIVIHAATLLSTVVYFRKDLIKLLNLRKKQNQKVIVNLIIVTIPAAIIGFLFEEKIDETFKDVNSIIFMLIFIGVIMLFIDKITSSNDKKISTMGKSSSLIIGLFQSLSFIRGTSRSGITIIGGLLNGLTRKQATKFAFLAGISIIGAATLFQIVNFTSEGTIDIGIMPLMTGFITAFLVGLISIKFLLKFLSKNTLFIFGIYRIILGLLLLYLY